MPTSKLDITLFGSPWFRLDGAPVDGFAMRKTQALLIYLAANSPPDFAPGGLLAIHEFVQFLRRVVLVTSNMTGTKPRSAALFLCRRISRRHPAP